MNIRPFIPSFSGNYTIQTKDATSAKSLKEGILAVKEFDDGCFSTVQQAFAEDEKFSVGTDGKNLKLKTGLKQWDHTDADLILAGILHMGNTDHNEKLKLEDGVEVSFYDTQPKDGFIPYNA